jgi:hypothetical protein
VYVVGDRMLVDAGRVVSVLVVLMLREDDTLLPLE